VFYPTSAHLDEGGKTWTVPVHGIIYEPEEGSIKRSAAVGAIRRAVRVEAGTPESTMFDRRIRRFLVDNERGKKVSIRLGSRDYVVGRSRANGHFFGELQLSVAEAQRLLGGREAEANWISFRALVRNDDQRRFGGRAHLIGPSGLSVISDVDDTIKHSQVGDRKAMLRNTFLRDFSPVPGMPELYQEWARQGVVFHYVSGSPWQLYLPLSEFLRAEGFPAGSFHLKHFRLKDSTAFSLLASQEKTKLGAIEPILAAFPGRRFILVGDSGEQDPEIYGKIAREHGRQIAAILIRNVTDEAADGERFGRAFERIQPQRWRLFGRPEQLDGLPGTLSESQEAARQ
ncbi:MAG: phosphatidate phosphatase App1 family protein, partial [Planctomycetota bacterium]